VDSTCAPQIVSLSAEYELVELDVGDCHIPKPVAITDTGTIIGSAHDRNRRELTWLIEQRTSLHVERFVGQAFAMNSDGLYTGQYLHTDGGFHMFTARLGHFLGGVSSGELNESCGLTINAGGDVAGWLNLSSEPRGQQNHRAAIWYNERCFAINNGLDGDWSEVIALNDNRLALIRSSRLFETGPIY
jgi:hypothetical protein